MWSNVDPLGGAAKRSGLGESPEPYEEEGVDECVKELSVRTTQEKDEEEEDERLDLVLGKLVKITDMLDLVRGSFVRMTNLMK